MAEIDLEKALEGQTVCNDGVLHVDAEPIDKPRHSVIRKKRSAARHMLRSFLQEDGRNAADYVFWEIVVPNVKSLIHDILDKGSARILWKDDARYSSGGVSYRSGGHTNYTSNYKQTSNNVPWNTQKKYPSYRQSHNSCFVDDLYFETSSEAEDILARMDYLIHNKGYALVSDYYEAAGLETTYIDTHFGWYTLYGSQRYRNREGLWVLSMPIPEEIAEAR